MKLNLETSKLNRFKNKKYRVKKGLALIELLLLVLPFCFTIFLVLSFIYLSWSRSYIKHHMYKTLICMAKANPVSKCKEEMIRNVDFYLKAGKFKKVEIKEGSNQWSIDVVWNLSKWGEKVWTLKLKRTLRIPEDLF